MANTFTSYVAKNVGTTASTLATVAASTQTTVIGLTVANTSLSTITCDIYFTRSAVDYYVVKGAGVPVGRSFVAVGGDQKVVLITSDALKVVTAGTTALASTAATGNGTTATISFATQTFSPAVGSSVTVSGVTPAGYNATATITASTTSSVSYLNATTGAQTVAGTVTLAPSSDVIASVLNIT